MNLRSRSSLFGGVAILLGQVASAGTQIVVFALLGKNFGQTALGHYALSLAYVTPVFFLLGLSLRVLYVTAHDEWDLRWFFRSSLLTAITCSTVSVAVSGIFGASIWFAILVSCVKGLDLIGLAAVGVMQRQRRLVLGSSVLLVNSGLSVLLASIAVIAGDRAELIIAASAFGSLSAAIVAWRIAFRLNKGPRSLSAKGTYSVLLRRGIPLGASTAIISLMVSLPAYFLGSSGNVALVGAYSVLANLRTVVNMGYGTLAQISLTGFSNAARDSDKAKFSRQLYRSMSYVLISGLILSSATIFFGPKIVPLVFAVTVDRWTPVLFLLSLGFLAAGVIYILDAALASLHIFVNQTLSALAALAATTSILIVEGDGLGLIGSSFAMSAGLVVAALFKYNYLRLARGRAK